MPDGEVRAAHGRGETGPCGELACGRETGDDRRPARRTKLEILKRLDRTRQVRVLVDDDELVCADADRAGFTGVRACWAAPSAELKVAQEREERT